MKPAEILAASSLQSKETTPEAANGVASLVDSFNVKNMQIEAKYVLIFLTMGAAIGLPCTSLLVVAAPCVADEIT